MAGRGKAHLSGIVPVRIGYRWATELYAYAHRTRKQRDVAVTRFALFGQGRTGSELLRSLINVHPHVHCDEEILEYRVIWPRAFVEGRCGLSKKRVYGFKVKIYQLTRVQGIQDPRQFMSDLHEGGWKVIYLKRRNVLRQALSGLVAHCTGIWHHRTTDEPLNLGRIHVDPEELVRKAQERQQLLEQEQAVLDRLPHLAVTYEHDLLDAEKHQDTLNRVFDYLGVPTVPVATELVRIAPGRLSELVANYDEVAALVRRTHYAECLEDEG